MTAPAAASKAVEQQQQQQQQQQQATAVATPPRPLAPRCPYQCPFPLTGVEVEFEGMTYRTFSAQDHLQFRSLADSTDASWNLRFDENGTFTWDKKIKGEAMRLIRVFGVMPDVPTELLYDVLHDASYRAVWDERRLDGYRFTMLAESCEIGYYAAKLGFALDDREFVNQRGWVNAGGGEFLIWNTSVPVTRLPKETNGRTRAISKVSGYLLRRWGNGGSSLTYMTMTDPRGWIPSTLINMVTTRLAPGTLQTLSAAAKKYPEWVKTQGASYARPWMTAPAPFATPQANNIYEFAAARAKAGSGAAPPALLPETSDDAAGSPASPTATAGAYWLPPGSPPAGPAAASGTPPSLPAAMAVPLAAACATVPLAVVPRAAAAVPLAAPGSQAAHATMTLAAIPRAVPPAATAAPPAAPLAPSAAPASS
jgi:hypothetical protein